MVKKKQAYFKNLRRTILKSKARILAIFAIVLLGAAFFAGLRNTPEIMMLSIDRYLDNYHFSDLIYLTNLGLSEDDIKCIEEIEGIDKIQYGYQFDALFVAENKLKGVTVYTNESYHEDMLNYPDLLEGEFPTQSYECLVDNIFAQDNNLKVGNVIKIKNDQGEKSFKITGLINDVRFLSDMDRGTNTLGDGSNDGFIEILTKDNEFLALPKEIYDLRDEEVLYNQLLVSVEGAKGYNLFSSDYDDYIESLNTKIKSQLSLRMSHLYDDITSDAREQLDKAEKEYEDGLRTYNESKDVFDSKILDAKIQLATAKLELAEAKKQYLDASKTATSGMKVLPEEIEKLQKQIDELNEKIKNRNFEISDVDTKEIVDSITILNDLTKELDDISKMLTTATDGIDGILQLSNASIQLQEAEVEIETQENKLLLEEYKTNKQLDNAKNQLDEAEVKISEAKEDIESIPKGQVYTLTWHENIGIAGYEANKDSISAIADVFPLMFFLVSALVSLTTMTRMVEEQRSQSGILRALGYSKWDVIKQYVIYVVLATFFACVLGIIIGVEFFPRIIYYLYQLMMYNADAPIFIVALLEVSFQTIFISVVVTLLVTLSVCVSELNLMPSVLMRPKAPKLGKRIILERITFIWKKLSFNQKVTMRNIFRYKKRFFMSVIGIAGCTALIITGFGVKDSVSPVVNKQYQEIFKYDASVRLEDGISLSQARDNQEDLLKREEISNLEYVYNQSVNLLKNKETVMGYTVVYQSMDNIANFITFNDCKTNKKLTLNDEGVIITQKAAEILNVEVDDTFDIELNGTKYNVKVQGIMENYVMNYVYMSQTYYESITADDLEVNSVFIIMKKDTASYKMTLEDYLLEKDYGNISFTSDAGSDFNVQIQSLNIIVVILIVCAGALDFIVLYNLTNINIQERKTEVATIKVLGFRRNEVYDYIFRENTLLSVIGSFVGVFLGTVLHQFIIRTVEMDMTMFIRETNPMSYLYAIVITIGFTKFINITMRHVLNKVNMVESLKSVE